MEKTYCCAQFPLLKLGTRIHFAGGFFTTSDLGLQTQVEQSDWYGGMIQLAETEDDPVNEETAAATDPDPDPPTATAKQGRRGTTRRVLRSRYYAALATLYGPD